VERLKALNELLGKEVQVLTMQAKIQSQAKEEITKTQKEYFLREQMRAIRSELGEVDERTDEIKTLHQKIKKAKMPKEVEKEARESWSDWSRCIRTLQKPPWFALISIG